MKKLQSRRKPSTASLRRKLDKVFSEFIRRRDCLPNGIGTCITCGKQRILQAGHFVPRQHRSTRWHPENVWGQCAACNCWGHGEQAEFYLALVRRLGQSKVDELMRLKRQTVKFNREDYETMLEKFK